jgi:tryptophan synthase alpha chain
MSTKKGTTPRPGGGAPGEAPRPGGAAAGSLASNRLVARLAGLAAGGGKAFVAYVMAGEPSRTATLDVVCELDRAGVTAVELGVPFSDPIADGPVIQAAGNRALSSGLTLRAILDDVAALRRRTQIPILLMGYWNVFLKAGRDAVLDAASAAGVDGLIIPDLPLEADRAFYAAMGERGLAAVLLATELTRDERLREIAAASTGFVYYVPKLGITGLDLEVTGAIRERIRGIKRLSRVPVCVGIGVKTRRDVELLTEAADGVIVGTRIVDFIDRNRAEPDLPARVGEMVRDLMA